MSGKAKEDKYESLAVQDMMAGKCRRVIITVPTAWSKEHAGCDKYRLCLDLPTTIQQTNSNLPLDYALFALLKPYTKTFLAENENANASSPKIASFTDYQMRFGRKYGIGTCS